MAENDDAAVAALVRSARVRRLRRDYAEMTAQIAYAEAALGDLREEMEELGIEP